MLQAILSTTDFLATAPAKPETITPMSGSLVRRNNRTEVCVTPTDQRLQDTMTRLPEEAIQHILHGRTDKITLLLLTTLCLNASFLYVDIEHST